MGGGNHLLIYVCNLPVIVVSHVKCRSGRIGAEEMTIIVVHGDKGTGLIICVLETDQGNAFWEFWTDDVCSNRALVVPQGCDGNPENAGVLGQGHGRSSQE